jgi:hypothetical protein
VFHVIIGFMDDNDSEGTLVLEQLAAIDLVDAFFDAIDADNFTLAIVLMKKAKVDAETIAKVLKEMSDGNA